MYAVLPYLVNFNPKKPKVFGVKFSFRKIGRIFSTKVRNFKLWRMPKLLNFRFLEEWYFWNCDNIELNRSSKIFFFRFRTASLNGSGLKVASSLPALAFPFSSLCKLTSHRARNQTHRRQAWFCLSNLFWGYVDISMDFGSIRYQRRFIVSIWNLARVKKCFSDCSNVGFVRSLPTFRTPSLSHLLMFPLLLLSFWHFAPYSDPPPLRQP